MIKLLTKKNRGFTLVELLVVGFIIALVSAIFLIGFRGGEEQFALQRSVHVLAQDIRQVQELAMRAENFKGSVSRGGFGVRLESATSSYILFADCNQNRLFDAGGNAISCVAATDDVPFLELLEIRDLEEGVTITSISPNPTSTIVFIPPDPAVRINHPANVTSTTIILSINGLTATITVNKAGLIAIE